MLTIALTNGTTVSGLVNNETRIIVVPPSSTSMGDNDGDNDDTGMSGAGSGGWEGHWFRDSGGSDQNMPQLGSTSNLTAGAVVLAAELQLSSAGAVWEKVVLMGSSTTPTMTGTSSSSS